MVNHFLKIRVLHAQGHKCIKPCNSCKDTLYHHLNGHMNGNIQRAARVSNNLYTRLEKLQQRFGCSTVSKRSSFPICVSMKFVQSYLGLHPVQTSQRPWKSCKAHDCLATGLHTWYKYITRLIWASFSLNCSGFSSLIWVTSDASSISNRSTSGHVQMLVMKC